MITSSMPMIISFSNLSPKLSYYYIDNARYIHATVICGVAKAKQGARLLVHVHIGIVGRVATFAPVGAAGT